MFLLLVLIVGLFFFTTFCVVLQDSLLPLGLWNYNMPFYESSDLHSLNLKICPKLHVELHDHCIALGIAHRPCYIHRGSHRGQCTKTASTISATGFMIPAVCRKACRKNGAVNLKNLRHLGSGSLGALLGTSTFSTITHPPVKMAPVNARSLANKTFILNNFFYFSYLGLFVYD